LLAGVEVTVEEGLSKEAIVDEELDDGRSLGQGEI